MQTWLTVKIEVITLSFQHRNKQSKMVTFLLMIFLGCSAVEKESDNCDRVQFSFEGQNHNFTKQYFEKDEQPVYYSLKNTIQTIIWWDNETNTWLSQTRTRIGNKITKANIKISSQILFSFFSRKNLPMINLQKDFDGL